MPAETVRATLRGLSAAAKLGVTRLNQMESAYRSAVGAIHAEYRPGKLPQLLALSLSISLLSPSRVAKELGLTLAGAGKLLERAEELGLVAETSGRRSWKTYLTPDLAIFFGFRRASVGRPKKLAASSDHDLVSAFSAFDREMADIDAVLATRDFGSACYTDLTLVQREQTRKPAKKPVQSP